MPRYIDADDLKAVIKSNDWSNLAVPNVVGMIIDRVPTADVVLWSDVEEWYHEYHRIKDELKQEREYHRSTEKLADKYCLELQTAKTEVERLTINMNAFALTAKRLKEDVDRLQEINARDVENIRLAKSEFARQIIDYIYMEVLNDDEK